MSKGFKILPQVLEQQFLQLDERQKLLHTKFQPHTLLQLLAWPKASWHGKNLRCPAQNLSQNGPCCCSAELLLNCCCYWLCYQSKEFPRQQRCCSALSLNHNGSVQPQATAAAVCLLVESGSWLAAEGLSLQSKRGKGKMESGGVWGVLGLGYLRFFWIAIERRIGEEKERKRYKEI